MVVRVTKHRRSGSPPDSIDLAQLVDEAPVGMAVLDRELRYLLCNQKLADINGMPQEAHIGRTVAEIVPGIAPSVEAAFRTVLAGETEALEFRVTGTTAREPETLRTWVENVRPMAGPGGGIVALVVTVQDVTDIESARAALEVSERRLAASHRLSHDGFCILRATRGPDGAIADFILEFANPAAARLLGRDQLVGLHLLETLPAHRNHPDLFPRYVQLLETQSSDEVELVYRADGLAGWIRNSAFAIDADRLAVSFRDITQRRTTQEQLRLVTQELKHRNRNLLTVVSGLLSLAARTSRDVPRLVEGVQKQLQALAASQDLLTSTIAGDVPLAAAIEAALEPFRTLRIHVEEGPKVDLPPRSVVPLIMALSEMATNAVKYGALSGAGHVDLGWTLAGRDVTLGWVERDGPPVSPPRRKGLGSRLLEAAGHSLADGRVEKVFDRSGLTIRFHFTIPD